MRIFITGANGQLAKSIIDLYPDDDIYLATRSSLDITNKKQVTSQISNYKPDIIFHFASMTRGDECAKNPKEAYKVNVIGTKNVVDTAKKVDSEILFVSTNEVFDGSARRPYTEQDTPNPITVVGKTKLEAENHIRNEIKKHYIVRTSWLYSKWSANFLHAVLKKAIDHKKIELVEDEIGSPTYSMDLATAIKKLITTKKYGTYHLINTGAASRLEFAKKAFQFYSLQDVKIIPIPLDKYQRLSKPPRYSALSNTKAKKIGIELSDWQVALDRFLSEHTLI